MSPELVSQGVPDSPNALEELQEVKCLKAVKSTARVTKLRGVSKKDIGSIPSLSESEPRSVAGHVSRERNRISMAEAAPSNSSKPSTSSETKPRRRRKRTTRQNASNDRDDRSDSDSDGRDDDREKDPGQSRRGVVERQEDETMDDGGSEELSKEENNRVRLLHTLTKVGSEWEGIRTLREHNKETGARRMRLLMRRYGFHMHHGEVSETTSRKMDDLALLDEEKKRRQDYLDDALLGHIDGKSQTADGAVSVETPDRLEELIQRAELGIIQRCWAVDPYARSWDVIPPKAQFRLLSIVKSLYSATWNHLSALPRDSERDYQADFVASCRFIEVKCHKSHLSTGETMIVDPVIDSYFSIMAEQLSEDVILDLRAGQRRLHLDTLRVCEKIQTSRHNDHLTHAYLAWASSRLDPVQKETLFLEWNRNKQQEILRTFRRLMHSAKMSIRQEFCSNIVTPGVVSLVLFKENWPSAVKDVTPDELRNMGWVLEEHRRGQQFVRFEPKYLTEGRRCIFKISMDEEVMAIGGLGGGRWIDWDEKDFSRDEDGQNVGPFS